MPQNPPEGYTRVTPYLYYKDAGAALDFITGVFGFKEAVRMSGEDGVVNHAEVEHQVASIELDLGVVHDAVLAGHADGFFEAEDAGDEVQRGAGVLVVEVRRHARVPLRRVLRHCVSPFLRSRPSLPGGASSTRRRPVAARSRSLLRPRPS